MASGARRSGERIGEARGGWVRAPRRDPYTEKHERFRRGGGEYDAGPGRELPPTAQMMDRPREERGTFERTGGGRESIDRGIRTIQDNTDRGKDQYGRR